MTATYTFDIFSSLDGFAGYENGDWGGYWGKQGPEFLEHRAAQYEPGSRMVFGANTYRDFAEMYATHSDDSEVFDAWATKMRDLPVTVVSSTLSEPLDWPGATVVSGDAVKVIGQLKRESDEPLRSHGSLSLNRALLSAGLVDYIQLTVFPVLTGETGVLPVFRDVADFDLELVASRVFDGNTQELTYRPTLH
ncbi:dihydrofolate reductase family protein [Gordonia soli]|uniref:Bacterial bifunctional deaminase-reductase C-terminal domain-containing protein n=1 Tax=Gordonia soli NBRC 108243 TaxID=1223545 RepID=M0QMF6_9ACTN|nr:dihydrofolate reductase family protein [Gordonia soli]GAC68592.1 hypothetical protein GS4_16_01230 [Gordonia soli NBRC 108243]